MPDTTYPLHTSSIPGSAAVTKSAAAIVAIVAVSALTGILTPLGEQLLPHAIRSMANSSGPWALVAFAAISLVGLTGKHAALMGAVSFLVMDLSFYVVFGALGRYYPHHYLAFWMVVGVVVGPLIGLCAGWLRDARPLHRSIGAAAPSAVLIGEGIFMLVRLPGESTLYAIASLVFGAALLVTLSRLFVRGTRYVATAIALTVAGAAAFYFVYGLIPLLLNKVVP